ncbi:hypothetical protein GPJ56_002836 [Histomonas meleagridis]|uniref:uncharacterized protein n=1 Tax=Histomonas meleagridis TaxID=135588 RepID=UPI00355AAAE6|nr:hypothetical protein GPJ56_002836 [Histomonas meleagridis]KAH0806352.1 hypothetical protein GO595_001040 [Histomonas meleagridis]
MIQTRPIANSEIWYLMCKCMVQTSIEIDKPSSTPEIVDKLKNRVIGLKLRQEGNNLVFQESSVKVHELPKGISTAKEASDYSRDHFMPELTDSLGTISANDKFITLNLNHICSDGGYIRNLLSALDKSSSELPEFGHFPLPLEYFYSNRIADAPANTARVYNDTTMTRALTTQRSDKLKNAFTRERVFFIPSHELQCYSSNTQTLHGLTESLLTSYGIAAMTINSKLSDFGCSTCVNMRHLISDSARLDICNHYSAVTVKAKTHENSTLESIGNELRRSLNNEIANGGLFAFMKACEEDAPLIKLPGVGLQMTSVGMLNLKKPIVDCYIGMQMNSEFSEDTIPLMISSVITEDKNVLALRLMYGPNKVSEKEASIIAKRIEYLLKNVPNKANVNEALNAASKII